MKANQTRYIVTKELRATGVDDPTYRQTFKIGRDLWSYQQLSDPVVFNVDKSNGPGFTMPRADFIASVKRYTAPSQP
jgi:hypothetical protein